MIYTTNAIESLNAQVRKAVRVRGHFPSEEAATKLIWLVLRNVQARWKNPPISWHAAKAQLAIQFEDRFLWRSEIGARNAIADNLRVGSPSRVRALARAG